MQELLSPSFFFLENKKTVIILGFFSNVRLWKTQLVSSSSNHSIGTYPEVWGILVFSPTINLRPQELTL